MHKDATEPVDNLKLADQLNSLCVGEWSWPILNDAATALRASHAEIVRLQQFKAAYMEWQDKTEWVQQSAQPKELGMHRADVLRRRVEQKEQALRDRDADSEMLRFLLSSTAWSLLSTPNGGSRLSFHLPTSISAVELAQSDDEVRDLISAAMAAQEGHT